jgi:hypothetical protein
MKRTTQAFSSRMGEYQPVPEPVDQYPLFDIQPSPASLI